MLDPHNKNVKYPFKRFFTESPVFSNLGWYNNCLTLHIERV